MKMSIEEIIVDLMENPFKVVAEPDMITHLMEYIKPLLRIVGNEYLSILKEICESEIYIVTAIGNKKSYDAYLAVGFTEEQAFNLMMKQKQDMADIMSKIGNSKQSK